MPNFSYRALNINDEIISGQLQAADKQDLERLIQGFGMTLLGAKKNPFFYCKPRITDLELGMLFFQLHQLVLSGFSLHQALKQILGHQKKHLAIVIHQLMMDIENGSSLSHALIRYPTLFNQMLINLIKVAELSGQLATVFGEIAANFQWQNRLKKQIHKMLMSPLLTLIVVLATTLFLLIYLVPQLSQFLHELKTQLPLITRIILASSETLRHLSLLNVMGISLFFLAGLILLQRHAYMHNCLTRMMVRLPLCGSFYQQLFLVKFLKRLLMLIKSGMSFDHALTICGEGETNPYHATIIQQMNQRIRVGQPLSRAFAEQQIFPPLMIQLLVSGEKSGDVIGGLEKILHLYEGEIEEKIQAIMKLTEPIMTLLLGTILCLVMLGILMPIYQSFEQMNF